MRRREFITGLCCPFFSGVALAIVSSPAIAMELITAQEASLPDAPGVALELGFRGVTRGPKVSVLSPAPDAGTIRSPLNLELKFESRGGSTIDLRSVKVIYLKQPTINLTQRVSELINTNGIEVSAAEMPPGTHYIKVEVKDSAGRLGSTIFPVTVSR
jgi:hypothetical protein